VGRIVKGHPLREFDGYANPEASKKKIAHNVFKKGDCYFLTGKIFLLKSAIIKKLFLFVVNSFRTFIMCMDGCVKMVIDFLCQICDFITSFWAE